MRLPTPHQPPAQISVVAMIDVLFAILTFFIFSAFSLTQSRGLPVNLPAAGSSKIQTSTKIVVSLNNRDELAVNRQSTSIAQLSATIQQVIDQELKSQAAPSQNNPTTIIINADHQSNHGRVTQLIDQIRRVPNIKIAIATKNH